MEMRSHVRLLATLEIIFGALGVLVGIGLLLMFGGIAAIVGLSDQSDGRLIAVPVLGVVGTVLCLIMVIIALPELLAGIGLLRERQWGRILSIILSALNLFNIPFGTLMGVYGLWVLLSNQGTAHFERRTA
jgi:hypothetical protein